MTKDSERYFANKLRLYMPHSGKDLKETNETYEEVFESGEIVDKGKVFKIHDIVVENMDQYEHNADIIDEAWEAVQHNERLEDGWADVAPGAEEQRHDDAQEAEDEEHFSDEEEVPQIPDLDVGLQSAPCAGRPTYTEQSMQKISSSQAEKIIRSMNNRQHEVFTYLRQWCIERVTGAAVDPFHVFVTGGAGTGKSHVINGFQYEASRLLSPITDSADEVTVLLVAYTGTAAFNIGGQTIHSAFAIHCDIKGGKYTPLGEEQLTRLRAKYHNLQILIIDEVSMVGQKMLMYVDERLKQIKQCQSAFGNVSVLAVGDFYQIPPVGDRTLYNVDPGRLCESPWTSFKLWELQEIMRQKEDLEFANLLNTIRAKLKDKGLTIREKEILSARCFREEEVPHDVLHIYPRNRDVDNFNEGELETCAGQITTLAADIIHTRGGLMKKRSSPAPKPNTMLRPSVSLAIDARVMLTTNLDVTDGLCNGVMGTVKKIVNTKNEQGLPQAVWVLFDNERVGASSRQLTPPPRLLHPQCVQIKPHTEQFSFQNMNITRHQYPLRLAWACTVHKTQGMTLQKCVVSFKGTFLAGMQYVALSRVTSLQGLYVTDYSESALYCEPKVTQSLQTMTPLTPTATPLLTSTVTGMTVIMHNIHSINAHLQDMTTNPELMSGDIIGLCETWLKPSDGSALDIPGYVMLRGDRPDNSGRGGVAFYIRDSTRFRLLPMPPGILRPGVEALFVELHDKTVVGVMYRSPTVPEGLFQKMLIDVMRRIPTPTKCIIGGDFNKDVSSHPEQVQFSALEQFEQLITERTYYVGSSRGSLLDHMYVRDCDVMRSGVLHTYYSDHDPVYVELQLP